MPILHAFVILWSLLLPALSMLHAEGGFKYSYLPKKVYEKQLFPVTIIDTRKEKTELQYEFEVSSKTRPLSTKPLLIRNGNDNFYTFYYKADTSEVYIPRIYINDNGKITILESHTIPVESLLSTPENFCGVLAADMKIRTHQVSHYDENSYLVTLSLEAYEANLEDMYLPHAEEFGIEELVRKGAKVKAEFFVVVPIDTKKIRFSYYNTIKQQYLSLEVPVELIDSTVVTQSDLNPKEDSFEKLKKYTFMTLVGFFFLMFVIYRDIFYLVLGTVSLITLLTFYTPKKKVCVKQGAPLYILPTENSSISTNIEDRIDTVLLGERLDYKKIEYKKGVVGWVKNEDLCKN